MVILFDHTELIMDAYIFVLYGETCFVEIMACKDYGMSAIAESFNNIQSLMTK